MSLYSNKDGETCQFISYMPYGEAIIDEHNTDYENPFKFTGMELDPITGLYDHGARQRDPIYLNWLNPDPLMEKNVAFSPYSYCAGNPVKFIDPNGCDTLDINYNNETQMWSFSKPIVAEGNDVFRIHEDGKTGLAIFSNSDYGDRIDMLNLYVGDSKDSYTLGIYHVNGSDAEGATGFYVTPGGEASMQVGSNARIPNGNYPMTTPNGTEQWQQPGVGGAAINRGVKFHFGYGMNTRVWTQGCYLISSTYYKNDNGSCYFKKNESRNQLTNFDISLGGIPYEYTLSGKSYSRIGATFSTPLQRTISIQTLYKSWQRK